MAQFQKAQKLKQVIAKMGVATLESMEFKGREGTKPVKWIGTQRSAFTHRKNQKRIKTIIEKEKESYHKRHEKREEKR